MNQDDWIWDGSGTPDAEDLHLAGALGTLRGASPMPPLPPRPGRPRRSVQAWPVFALAVVLAWIGVRWYGGWEVRAISGAPPCQIGPCRWGEGEALETGADSRWEAQVADLGRLELASGSRLTRVESAPERHRLRLDHGALSLQVVAPPRVIVIDTPAATATDLGCAFDLEAAPDRTALTVRSGAVALENAHGLSIVGAGSAAAARVDRRPELPIRLDAPPALRAAIRAADPALGGDPSAISAVLPLARPEDLETLWHLLQMARDPGAVLDRMIALAPEVRPADPAPVLSLDGEALRGLWRDIPR